MKASILNKQSIGGMNYLLRVEVTSENLTEAEAIRSMTYIGGLDLVHVADEQQQEMVNSCIASKISPLQPLTIDPIGKGLFDVKAVLA